MSRLVAISLVSVLLALSTIGADSCDSSGDSENASKGEPHPTATTAGNLAHCRKVTGAYMFQGEKLPFTAAYRRGIDGACKAADPSTNVAAVAAVARSIAKGETP